jgi:sec-independent protein translocase protein TatA
MLGGLEPQELLVILVILLVLFGGAKLPQLARNLGRAQKEFKEGLAEGRGGDAAKAADTAVAADPVTPTTSNDASKVD